MNAQQTARVAFLRAKAVEPGICYMPFYLHFFSRYAARADITDHRHRLTDAWVYAFDRTPVEIDAENELIVGRASTFPTEDENARFGELYRTYHEEVCAEMGQDSHMSPDFALLLQKGITGILDDIAAYRASCTDTEKAAFYEDCAAILRAVVRFSHRYAAHARALADTAAPNRREELLEIAQVCERVPAYPAGNFREAVQATHFLAFVLSFDPLRPYSLQQFQLGRIDRYLYPYYRADKAAGILDDGTAQMYLDLLAIQINNRVPHGLSSGYMVGGRDRNGNPVQNELTMMGMQVIDDVRLVYPSVGLCMTRDTEERYLEKACEILSHGRSHPAIFNDDIITEGLRTYGVREDDAHDYIHSTCVEITPGAASNVWVASPYTNMPALLLDELDAHHPDFDTLVSAVLGRLDDHIRRNFEEQNRFREIRRTQSYHPLLSCFVNDCLARGTDIEAGGARYNWIMPSFVGMANLVDALYAVKVLVYDEKSVSYDELQAALDANFAGAEALRHRLLDGVAKYGNDNDAVDGLFCTVVDHIVAECKQYTAILPEGKLIPSVFCWIMHELFGRQTGATPDGRPAGFPLGDGSGPCQGRESCGPTASVLSTTKWSHKELIGGVAMNVKFARATFDAQSGEKLRALIHVYLARGGFEMQINVVDRETLLAAQREPESYKDLVVRIGGYSDYFTKISPEMQAEVLLRSAHTI